MTLCEAWKKHLEAKGVKLPRVGTWRRKTLEYLFKFSNTSFLFIG